MTSSIFTDIAPDFQTSVGLKRFRKFVQDDRWSQQNMSKLKFRFLNLSSMKTPV